MGPTYSKKSLVFSKNQKKTEFQQYLHNVQCSRMCAMPTNTNIEIDYVKSFLFLILPVESCGTVFK